jgi:hypothetical protein
MLGRYSSPADSGHGVLLIRNESESSQGNKIIWHIQKNKQTPWSESASEPYRPSDLRLSAKLVPTFADRGCHVVSVTDPYCRNLGFVDRSRYVSIK